MKAYTKSISICIIEKHKISKCGPTMPPQKVKLLACIASFYPLLIVFFLEISSPKIALKYQLMLTSHLHKEWEAILFVL